MTNAEFQKAVLGELKGIKGDIGEIRGEIGEIKARVSNMEVRQDEIYHVVRAIEHSNQVGKSELDSQNIRLAKVEGKLKRVAKAYNEEVDVGSASNL